MSRRAAPEKSAHVVQQDVGQDLPQPGCQLGFVGAAELGEVADGFEQGLLDDVGRVELGAKPRLDLKPSEQTEPASMTFESGDWWRVGAGTQS